MSETGGTLECRFVQAVVVTMVFCLSISLTFLSKSQDLPLLPEPHQKVAKKM